MWLAKLQRMIDELPKRYLQPEPVGSEAMMLILPGSKPVSQLTEEEKKLNGVCRQLGAAANLEFEAHIALYGPDESKHPPEACQKLHEQMNVRDEEIQLVSAILARSLKERLGFENEYIIDNYDVYAVPYVTIAVINPDTGDEPETPDEEVDIPGFKGWPDKES